MVFQNLKASLYNPKYEYFHVLDVLITGFIIGLTHAIPPGPITFEVLRRGVVEGAGSALKVDIGAVLADVIFFILITAGLYQFIDHPTARIVMWLAGCTLLTYLGLRGIYRVITGRESFKSSKKTEMDPLLAGFLICITSPFAIAWWTGVFAGSMAVRFLGDIMSLVTMFGGIALACFSWYGLIAIGSSRGKKYIDERMMGVLSFLCSLMMILFAAILFYRGFMAFV